MFHYRTLSKYLLLRRLKTKTFSLCSCFFKNIKQMTFLKRKISLGMCMLCAVAINKQKYCFERKNWSTSSQKDFWWLLFLGLQFYQKETPTQVFSYEYCKIFKNTYFKEHLKTPAHEYRFTYHFRVLLQRPRFIAVLSIKGQRRIKRCKDNVVLSTILRRFSSVLITTFFVNNTTTLYH